MVHLQQLQTRRPIARLSRVCLKRRESTRPTSHRNQSLVSCTENSTPNRHSLRLFQQNAIFTRSSHQFSTEIPKFYDVPCKYACIPIHRRLACTLYTVRYQFFVHMLNVSVARKCHVNRMRASNLISSLFNVNMKWFICIAYVAKAIRFRFAKHNALSKAFACKLLTTTRFICTFVLA